MKEIKAGDYSTMPEMVAELKIPTGLDNINCHLDGFHICIDYDSFSNKFIVTMSHEVSIKVEGLELTIRMGFKENEILRGIPIYDECEMIYSVICIYRYNSESVNW